MHLVRTYRHRRPELFVVILATAADADDQATTEQQEHGAQRCEQHGGRTGVCERLLSWWRHWHWRARWSVTERSWVFELRQGWRNRRHDSGWNNASVNVNPVFASAKKDSRSLRRLRFLRRLECRWHCRRRIPCRRSNRAG